MRHGFAVPRRQRVLVAIIGVLAITVTGGFATPSSAQETPGPETIGAFTAPFEEGGAAEPRCFRDEEGRILCKPTAVSAVPLRDGRVLYWNGIEGSENVTFASGNELSPDSRDSRARTLDLSGAAPLFDPTTPEGGGATNPEIDEGQDGSQDPFGQLGVPGRPGDGLVGSTVGQFFPQQPTSPPDDPEANDGDMFCSYPVQLGDGRILVFGGTDWYNEPATGPQGEPTGLGSIELEGLRNTRVFDPATDNWGQTGHMKHGRWYPSGATLPDGKVLVASGVTKLIKNTQLSNVRHTETYDPATGEWTSNEEPENGLGTLPLYPRMHLMPNGKVFYAGNGQSWTPMGQAADEALWALQKFWDPETRQWELVGPAALGSRSSALDVLLPLKPPYDEATVLMAGGVLGPTPGAYIPIVTTEEYTVGADGTVTREQTGDLNHARWFSQGVLLADGTVLGVNGGDVDEVVMPGSEAAIHQAELYDPETGEWTPAAIAERDRTYHNSAVLLADGRVLVGGHSPIPLSLSHHRDVRANNDKDPSFQIYSPPYLFRGERPSISRAPAGIAWGSSFPVTVKSSSQIESVLLTRLQATTHVVDNDQRALFLEFSQEGAHLTVTAPPDGTAAPPGYYHLFVNRSSEAGPVPSIAAIVRVGDSADRRTAPQPLSDSTIAAAGGSATEPEDTTLRTPGDCPGCDDGESTAARREEAAAVEDVGVATSGSAAHDDTGATAAGAHENRSAAQPVSAMDATAREGASVEAVTAADSATHVLAANAAPLPIGREPLTALAAGLLTLSAAVVGRELRRILSGR